MKTTSVLILLSIFIAYGTAYPYKVKLTEKATIEEKEEVTVEISEEVTVEEKEEVTVEISEEVTVEEKEEVSVDEKAGLNYLDPITLVQFVTSNTCFFVNEATLPNLDDAVVYEVRLQLGDWCARLSEFVWDQIYLKLNK